MTKSLAITGIVIIALAVSMLLYLNKQLNAAEQKITDLNGQLETVQKERDTARTERDSAIRQHNAEQAIEQQGLAWSQHGTEQQEKTQIEIRTEIIHAPCAAESVPDAVAQRLWQLTTRSRAAAVAGATGQPDGVASGPTPGE